MREVIHKILGTWPGRNVVGVLLLVVLGLGALFAAGHSATSLHIWVVTSGCQLCTEPAGEMRFDETFTDAGFVHSLQDAMNTAPEAGIMTCGQDHYRYVFDFLTGGVVVVQSYASDGCGFSKSTLGVPSADVLLFDVTYHGQRFFDALHQDIGLPV
jgi:hypothetical protein